MSPEGDTVFRAARTLHHALAGRSISRFDSVFPRLTRGDADQPLCGRHVERVTAQGKHLLIWLSGGLVLRTHMRMHGSWHLYRPGERWRRPGHEMRILIGTDTFDAVAFSVPAAELIQSADVDRHDVLGALGPDVLDCAFDHAAAVERLRLRADLEIGEALLDQRALSGVGNIWKSESLFMARVNPFIPVATLAPETLDRILRSVRRLMQASAVGARSSRLTRCVYMRAGQPCRRCGTTITRRVQGANARSTYWCERCQPR